MNVQNFQLGFVGCEGRKKSVYYLHLAPSSRHQRETPSLYFDRGVVVPCSLSFSPTNTTQPGGGERRSKPRAGGRTEARTLRKPYPSSSSAPAARFRHPGLRPARNADPAGFFPFLRTAAAGQRFLIAPSPSRATMLLMVLRIVRTGGSRGTVGEGFCCIWLGSRIGAGGFLLPTTKF